MCWQKQRCAPTAPQENAKHNITTAIPKAASTAFKKELQQATMFSYGSERKYQKRCSPTAANKHIKQQRMVSRTRHSKEKQSTYVKHKTAWMLKKRAQAKRILSE